MNHQQKKDLAAEKSQTEIAKKLALIGRTRTRPWLGVFIIAFSLSVLAILIWSVSGYQPASKATVNSDLFPPYEAAPDYTTYFADRTPNKTYYCSPTGSNESGNGSLQTPWLDLRGASGRTAPGDLVLFRGGVYEAAGHAGSGVLDSANFSATSGTASDRIVFKNYPGETPIFRDMEFPCLGLRSYQVLDGIKFEGGIDIENAGGIIQNCDFSYASNYGNDGNPTMIYFPAHGNVSNFTARNNIFHDPILHSNDRVYAFVMFDSNVSGGYTRIMYNKFFNFNASGSQEFIVYNKDCAHGVEIAYNRFYNSDALATGAFGQCSSTTTGYSVHHNLVYNCGGLAWDWGKGVGSWYSNVVIETSYAGTAYYDTVYGRSYGMAGDGTNTPLQSWGQVYDNVFYVDRPGYFWYNTTAGWYNWVDYNAYVSAASKNSFVNPNGETANWQQHTVIESNRISITGEYFATLPADSLLYNAGRNGGTIGGFTFSGSPADTTPPSPPANVSIN